MFGPSHRQHLLVAFRHLDETLAEVLQRLGAPPGAPLFARVRDDVDPAARDGVVAAIAEVRRKVHAFMAGHALDAIAPDAGATHVARARLDLAMVSAAELGARHLRGYGELADADADALEALATTLRDQLAAAIALLAEPPS